MADSFPSIEIFDETGERVGMTYERRAGQLVAKGRAQWLDRAQTSIRLTPAVKIAPASDERVGIMDYEGYAPNGVTEREPEREFPAREERSAVKKREFYTPAEIDGELYAMAKSRVHEKYQLIMHMAAYAAGSIGLMILAETIFMGSSFFVGLMAIGWVVWSIAAFLHFVYFLAKPSPEKILRKYDRLRRGKR